MSILVGNGRRNIVLFFAALITLVLVLYAGKFNPNSDINSSALNGSPVVGGHVEAIMPSLEKTAVSQQQSNPLPAGIRVVNSSADVYGKFSGTKAQLDELNQWRLERGYMPPNTDKEQNIYNSYTEEALRALAKDGDIAALHVLADRYGDIDYIKANGIDILTVSRISGDFLAQAAIRGSIRALMEQGIDYGVERRKGLISDAENKAIELEVLAIYKVAMFRGDPDHYIDELRVAKGIRGVEITDLDKQHIDLRAKEIYADLQAKRKELGLGDFDNSVPETVKNFYELKYGANYQ